MIRIELGVRGGIWGFRLYDSSSQIANVIGYSSPERALSAALDSMESAFSRDGTAGFEVDGKWEGPEEWKWPADSLG